MGDLLATVPHLSSAPTKDQVSKMLDICLFRYARGNISGLSRMLGMDLSSVWGYLRDGVQPTLKNLLRMCYAFSISPLEFLTTRASLPRKGPQFVIDQLPMLARARGYHVTEEDIRTYRLALEQVLALDAVEFPTLSQIVKKLGCGRGTLQRHCADLCKAISARQHRPWTEETYAIAKQELENALKSSKPVHLQSICKRIGCGREVLQGHFPDLCKFVVSQYQSRFDHQRYQKRLLEELANEGAVLSVADLARELDLKDDSLRRWFPNECRQLSKRYRAERREGSRDRGSSPKVSVNCLAGSSVTLRALFLLLWLSLLGRPPLPIGGHL